ncbi:MAG TPA: amidohydrolase family protein [Novosphingobium sp.]|nr:amidohydrolase family protein [Novosphingobium sp.]
MQSIFAKPIIDTDTHVTEPPDLWTARMPRKYGDVVPHVKLHPKRELEYWYIGEKPVFSAWGSANYGYPGGPLSIPPRRNESHPGAWDVHERLKYMNETGVWAQVLYPNLGAVVMGMYKHIDDEVKLGMVQVYNDFMIEFSSAAPERFIPMAVLPLWDIAASVREVERAAKIGHKGVLLSGAPHEHGWPYLSDRAWDPLWSAIRAANLPISFHSGGGDFADDFFNPARNRVDGVEVNYVRSSTLAFLMVCGHMADLLMSGVPQRFPELRFAAVETGLGHINFCIESLDYHFKVAEIWKIRPEFKELPSETFRKQVFVNYWFEQLDDFYIKKIGEDNIMFETDFPHTTCLGGRGAVAQALTNGLERQPERVQDKILFANAAKLYNVELPKAAFTLNQGFAEAAE